jgi:hypothetical protein
VVKACLALEYPPSAAGGRDTGGVSESIPLAAANFNWNAHTEGPAPGGTGVVHFDMDPDNSKFYSTHERACPKTTYHMGTSAHT